MAQVLRAAQGVAALRARIVVAGVHRAFTDVRDQRATPSPSSRWNSHDPRQRPRRTQALENRTQHASGHPSSIGRGRRPCGTPRQRTPCAWRVGPLGSHAAVAASISSNAISVGTSWIRCRPINRRDASRQQQLAAVIDGLRANERSGLKAVGAMASLRRRGHSAPRKRMGRD